ncbi:MAG: hypothetical protein R3C68_14925 [Myxococcota bacterium]
MVWGLSERIETVDGSRPAAESIVDTSSATIPLGAFGVLSGGDVYDGITNTDSQADEAQARAYFSSHIKIVEHGKNDVARMRRIEKDIVQQLSGNPFLARRMTVAKPLVIDIVPQGQPIASLGYPRMVSARAAGIFWNQPEWPHGRIALRADCLPDDPVLVVHEFAHAIHYLGFTVSERALIYQTLKRTFGSVAAMDEVFAIYSEREFLTHFSIREQQVPGVYGFTRRQWSEDHLFTRFVRKLYFPKRSAAGPRLLGSGDWQRGLSRSR